MRLSGWRLPLERLSATSLSTFIQCPEQFRHKYILNEEETMSGPRFMGSVHHQALASLFDPGFLEQEGIQPDDSVHLAWDNVIEREGEPEWHDMDATEAFRRAKQMINTYWPIAEKIKPIRVEERFEEKISGVSVVGYIDRELEDRILEVKTASAKVSKPKPRWGLQGRIYGLVSGKPISWHVITRQVTPKVYTEEECPELFAPGFNPDMTIKIVTHAIERMNDLWARHGQDEVWPMEGIHGDWACAWCSYRKSCPAWS